MSTGGHMTPPGSGSCVTLPCPESKTEPTRQIPDEIGTALHATSEDRSMLKAHHGRHEIVRSPRSFPNHFDNARIVKVIHRCVRCRTMFLRSRSNRLAADSVDGTHKKTFEDRRSDRKPFPALSPGNASRHLSPPSCDRIRKELARRHDCRTDGRGGRDAVISSEGTGAR